MAETKKKRGRSEEPESSSNKELKTDRRLDYKKFISISSSRRLPSPIRQLQPLRLIPGMISLGEGRPNSALFPFQEITVRCDNHDLKFSESELGEALNYSMTDGLPILTKELKLIQQREHKPPLPSSDWSLIVTNGSQDAICKAFEAFINEGDYVIVEIPTYAGALEILRPLGANYIEVEMDGDGLIPEKLEEALKAHKGKPPKVLYTVPIGHNPAGCTLTDERKRKIYKLACEYDFLIFEDDPYYYLHYGKEKLPEEGKEGQWTRPKMTSFFSLDTEGRVLRFDSMSKILSSGLRLGFVTAPLPLLTPIERGQEVANMHVSGVVQTIVAKLLKHWGEEGWKKHTDRVSLFYGRRRDWFSALCEKYLKGLAEWSTPSGGMFIWFKLPGVEDSQDLIQSKAVSAKVLMVPGVAFAVGRRKSNCVRACFSNCTQEQAEIAIQRFAKLIKGEESTID